MTNIELEMLRRYRLASKEIDQRRANTEEARRIFEAHGLDPDAPVSDEFVNAVFDRANEDEQGE